MNQILCHHLGVWKHCAHWVPQQLTRNGGGVSEWCLHMLPKFDGSRSERVWDIVMDINTFVYQRDLETKQPSSVWLFPGESPQLKFNRSRSISKQMITVCFSKSNHVASVLLQERKTVNAEWHINVRLPKVFKA